MQSDLRGVVLPCLLLWSCGQIIWPLVLMPESILQHARFLAMTDTYHKHTASDGYAITSDTPHLIWADVS
jgi:hypothetical protein